MSRVSVLIPVFNGAEVVGQAIDNLLGQTAPPTEIVIADDGSRDGLAARVGALQTRCEARGVALRYLAFPENRGRGAARNLALEAATGDLVAWYDIDDLWSSEKLAAQAAGYERLRSEHPFGRVLLTCNYWRYDPPPALISRVIRPSPTVTIDDLVSLHLRRHIQLQTVFGPRETFLRHRFDDGLNRVEDFDFALRFAAAGGKFVNPDGDGPPLVHYFRNAAKHCEEAAACNRSVVEKHRAIFRTNHIDPEAFLSAKLESMFAKAGPPADGVPTTAPWPVGRCGPRVQDAAGGSIHLAVLPDGSLRINLRAGDGLGECVAENAERVEIGRGAFGAAADIPQFQIADWFMAGARFLRLRAKSGSGVASERLRVVRAGSGLISVAR